MSRFISTASIQTLTDNVRLKMRRRDANAQQCLGCGRPVREHEHGVHVAGALCHAECALYRPRGR